MKIWDKKKGKYREGKILTMYEDYEQLINNLEQLVSRFDILEVGGGRGRKQDIMGDLKKSIKNKFGTNVYSMRQPIYVISFGSDENGVEWFLMMEKDIKTKI